MKTLCCTLARVIFVILLLFTAVTVTRAATIVVTTTIQAAVDGAQPGDTIFVPNGTYFESVKVTKNGISIVGSQRAVIDAGNQIGIRVGIGSRTTVDGVRLCPSIGLHNFTLRGLTIRNAKIAAVFLIGVQGYHLTGTRYFDDPVYGPFPVCSRDGLIDDNYLVGGNSSGLDQGIDAGIYVGDSNNATVKNNFVTNYAVGVEIENTANAVVKDNILSQNTGGITVIVLPGLNNPFSDNILIEHNLVLQNNLPNPVPFDPSPDGDPLGNLPTGSGIVNLGGHRVVIRYNTVIGNNSLGVAIGQNPFAFLDPRIDPNPDHNEVRDNLFLSNGRQPDPVRSITPGADIIYDATGVGTCFRGNIFRSEFPSGITTAFRCS